jgi:foldase protein PrsA
MLAPLRSAVIVLATCALALGVAACGGDEKKSSQDVPPDAIAVIGNDEIPKTEFDDLIERAKKSYKEQKRPFPKPGTKEYNELKDRAVTYLVQRYEFRKAAEDMDIGASDAEVEKRLGKIKKETFGGDEQMYRRELKRLGLTDEDAHEQIRDVIIQEKLFKEVTKDVKVTDEDVEKYYRENKAQFTQPASREVRRILVKKSRAKVDEVYARVKAGGNFAALAKKYSEDEGTKIQGGKFAAVKGQNVPEFDKVAFALKTGDVSTPVKTQLGWEIIKAVGPVKPEKVTQLEDVKDQIRQQLLQQKQSEAMRKWVEQLQKKYEDEVVYAAGFAPPNAQTTTGTTTQ